MTAATPKLPIWRTARETYALIFGNLRFLLRAGLPWLVLAVVLLVGFDWAKLQVGGWVGTNELPWHDLPEILLASVLQVGCLAPFAVRWHRHVLHSGDAHCMPTPQLILAYAMTAFLIEVLFYVVLWMPAINFPADGSSNLLLWTIYVIAFFVLPIAGAYLWGRTTLILPAIALGRDRSFGAAWTASRGNGWRLFWSSLLASMLPIAVWLAFSFGRYVVRLSRTIESVEPDPATTAPTDTTPVWDVLDSIESNIMLVLFALLAISFLSVAYRELVLKRDHASAPASAAGS